jgi:hypothetical protein
MIGGAVERGCGFRESGAAYLVTETSPFGQPVEHFLIDSPRVVDPEAVGLSAISMMPFRFPGDDTTHAMNWVGEENYPNVADFIEEGKRYGFSTRIRRNFDFSVLVQGSYIFHVHRKAHIDNMDSYHLNPPKSTHKQCPKDRHSPVDITEMCVRLFWQDIVGGESAPEMGESRAVRRALGDTSYSAYAAPDGVVPRYKPAVFLRVPIHAVEIINDPQGGTHELTYDKVTAHNPGVEVRLVDF